MGDPFIVMHGGKNSDIFQVAKALTRLYAGYFTIDDAIRNVASNAWQRKQLLLRSVSFLK